MAVGGGNTLITLIKDEKKTDLNKFILKQVSHSIYHNKLPIYIGLSVSSSKVGVESQAFAQGRTNTSEATKKISDSCEHI